MSDRDPTDEPGDGQGGEGEAPHLQSTAEREALPLPVPGSEPPAGGAESSPEPPTSPAEPAEAPEPSAAAAEAASAQAPEPDAPPVDEPAPYVPPPDVPADGVAQRGPRPELLVGAAFAGGLALAVVLRWLRS